MGRIVISQFTCIFIIILTMGCGGENPPPNVKVEPVKEEQPPKKILVLPSAPDALAMPRAELAQLCEKVLGEIKFRETARREGNLKYELFELDLPQAWPVFQDMTWNEDLGISLPTYADSRTISAQRELLLQYARFGDVQAAEQRGAAAATIQRFRLEKNFPVEWTRFIAMKSHSLQQQIALGEETALQELVDHHNELKTLLKDVAQAPLGRTLLNRGRQTLQRAAMSWKRKGNDSIASRAESMLEEWPAPAEFPLPDSWLLNKADMAAALGIPAEGRVIRAVPPTRALDILQLPYPVALMDAVLLGFDAEDRLAGVLLLMASRARTSFALPRDLTAVMSDFTGPHEESSTNLSVHQWGNFLARTRMCRNSPTLGAWAQFTVSPPVDDAVIPRQWATVHLDRGYEQNRMFIAPGNLTPALRLGASAARLHLMNPIPALPLDAARLERAASHDLLARFALMYDPDATRNMTADYLIAPIWGMLGPAELIDNPTSREHSSHLNMRWADSRTEALLRIPHSPAQAVSITLSDNRTAPEQLTARLSEARKFEATLRENRLSSGNAWQALPRKIEQLGLGMTNSSVRAVLPHGSGVVITEFPNGLLVVNNTPPARGTPFTIRQHLVLFDSSGKLIYAETRYADAGGRQSGDWRSSIVSNWESRAGAVSPRSWPRLKQMNDLPPMAANPVYYSWQDDISEAHCLVEPNSVTVALWDREGFSKDAATQLRFLSRGPTESQLTLGVGMSGIEASILSELQPAQDGAKLYQPSSGPFDAVLLWKSDDRVNRISARFRARFTPDRSISGMAKALQDQWGREISQVGWPDRSDFTRSAPPALQGLTWMDDITRYRLYWAESQSSPPTLWAEWKTIDGSVR